MESTVRYKNEIEVDYPTLIEFRESYKKTIAIKIEKLEENLIDYLRFEEITWLKRPKISVKIAHWSKYGLHKIEAIEKVKTAGNNKVRTK